MAASADGSGLGVGSGDGVVAIQTPNTPPVAEDQTVATPEDASITITLQATDADRDSLAFSHGGASNGLVSGSGANLTYTPNTDFFGQDSFTFTVSDGKGGSDSGTVTITVTEVNDPPTASDQTVTTSENTSVSITLQATDPDGLIGCPLN